MTNPLLDQLAVALNVPEIPERIARGLDQADVVSIVWIVGTLREQNQVKRKADGAPDDHETLEEEAARLTDCIV